MGDQIFRIVFFKTKLILDHLFCIDKLHFKVIFRSDKFNGGCVEALVDRDHHTQIHTGGNDVGSLHIQQVRQIADGNELGNLQDRTFQLFELFQHCALFFPLFSSLTTSLLTLAAIGPSTLNSLKGFAHFLLHILIFYPGYSALAGFLLTLFGCGSFLLLPGSVAAESVVSVSSDTRSFRRFRVFRFLRESRENSTLPRTFVPLNRSARPLITSSSSGSSSLASSSFQVAAGVS